MYGTMRVCVCVGEPLLAVALLMRRHRVTERPLTLPVRAELSCVAGAAKAVNIC